MNGDLHKTHYWSSRLIRYVLKKPEYKKGGKENPKQKTQISFWRSKIVQSEVCNSLLETPTTDHIGFVPWFLGPFSSPVHFSLWVLWNALVSPRCGHDEGLTNTHLGTKEVLFAVVAFEELVLWLGYSLPRTKTLGPLESRSDVLNCLPVEE